MSLQTKFPNWIFWTYFKTILAKGLLPFTDEYQLQWTLNNVRIFYDFFYSFLWKYLGLDTKLEKGDKVNKF